MQNLLELSKEVSEQRKCEEFVAHFRVSSALPSGHRSDGLAVA